MPITREQAQAAVDAYAESGHSPTKAARMLGVSERLVRYRVKAAEEQFGIVTASAGSDRLDHQKTHQIDRLSELVTQLRKENDTLRHEAMTASKITRLIHDCDYRPTVPKWKLDATSRHNTGVPTLFLSDIHFDEVVDPAQIGRVNAYNREIATRRLHAFFTNGTAIWKQHITRGSFDYVVLLLGGDLLSGNIHEELRETNERPIALSIMGLIDVLIPGIDLLVKEFGKVFVPCVVGNHGRLDKKPRMKNRAYDSFEFFVYHFLARHYQGDERVTFQIADGPDLPFSIYQTRYVLTHGDQARGGSGIAGALSPLMLMDHRKRKRAMATAQDYEYLVMGHWHQLMMVKGMIVNGSVKGYDEYAAASNFDFEIPQQASWLTHHERGITARWPIALDPPRTTY